MADGRFMCAGHRYLCESGTRIRAFEKAIVFFIEIKFLMSRASEQQTYTHNFNGIVASNLI